MTYDSADERRSTIFWNPMQVCFKRFSGGPEAILKLFVPNYMIKES